MTKTATAHDRIADAAVAELTSVRPSNDAVGAAVAAAALLAERAALEISDRDRVIRIAKREGATLRALAEATGLSRQTIANICAAGSPPTRRRARAG
ncbi:MAG: helix-turn-helix transcriptional regulator [Actinobacteria bacterium]|nr:helix-turn-helix transcriptional regulator [Actinomycetota bacterium]